MGLVHVLLLKRENGIIYLFVKYLNVEKNRMLKTYCFGSYILFIWHSIAPKDMEQVHDDKFSAYV